MSIVKVFDSANIRFVDHPEGKYDFGIVADDLAFILEASSGANLARSVEDEWKGSHIVSTPGGSQSMVVIWEPGVYESLSKSRKPQAKPFKKWLFEDAIPSIRKTGKYELNPQQEQAPSLPVVTDETVKVFIGGIRYLTDNGDLQLAQLLKCSFGNRLLAEQQNLLKPADIPQYEGAVEVATRLGFKVPANYEGSLGSHVVKSCRHLLVGHNKRYSSASASNIVANMYPANHPDVEAAVLDYCVGKAFYRRDIRMVG